MREKEREEWGYKERKRDTNRQNKDPFHLSAKEYDGCMCFSIT